MSILTLEVYYRYENAFGGSKKGAPPAEKTEKAEKEKAQNEPK
jgi:hypothetical protein